MVAVTHQGLLEKLLLAVLIHKRVLYITENNHWRKLNHNVLYSTTKGKSCDHTMQIITHFSKIYQYLCLAQKKYYYVPGPKSPELLVYIVLLSFWSKACLSPSPIFTDSNLNIHYLWQTAIQEHRLISCTACKLRGYVKLAPQAAATHLCSRHDKVVSFWW